MTWSTGPSTPRVPTGSGAWTHRAPPATRATCTSPSCSTPAAGGSSAGPSPITGAPSASPMPSRWPPGASARRRRQTIAHAHRGHQYTSWSSAPACEPPACSARWQASGTASHQCRRGVLLRPPARTPRPAPLPDPVAAGLSDLRANRMPVQPPPPSQLLRRPQPYRLRHRQRGMIT